MGPVLRSLGEVGILYGVETMIYSDETFNAVDERSRQLLQRIDNFYEESIHFNQSFRAEARIDTEFLAGSQEFYNTLYGPLVPSRRNNFFFNHIRPIHNMIVGRQMQNRKTTIVVPRQKRPIDQITCDQLTKVMMWVHEKDNMYYTISQAFAQATAVGFSLMHMYMDYRNDPVCGDIKLELCGNNVLIDPYLTKKDLSDCSAIWKRTYMTRREAMNLLPQYAEDIATLPPDTAHNKFMPENPMGARYYTGRVAYDEFWYRDYRQATFLIDVNTLDKYEWSGKDEDLNEYLFRHPNIQVQKTEVPTVNCAISVEGHCFYNENINGLDVYPFIPMFCYFDPYIDDYSYKYQGIVRSLRSAQYLYNRRMILEFDQLESRANAGFIYHENALVDKESVYKTGNGRGIAVKSNVPLSEAAVPIPAEFIPPTNQELRKDTKAEMNQISGASEELLGAASDDIAGVLSKLRQGANLVALQPVFDNVDYSQTMVGEVALKLVQKNFASGKVRNILGDEEPTELFNNHVWGDYACVVEEGVYTSTQKQMQFVQMMELIKLGVQIPQSELIKASTLQNKNDIIEAIQQSEKQAAEQQQQQLQVQMAQIQAQANMANAKADADRGLAMERASEVIQNEASAVERKAEAKKDEMQAILNMIKSMKEIEQLDVNELESIIRLKNMLSAPVTAGQSTPLPSENPNAQQTATQSSNNSGTQAA